jgi:predicted nucleic acid-binding protein
LADLAYKRSEWAEVLERTRSALEQNIVSQAIVEMHLLTLLNMGETKTAEERANRVRSFFPESSIVRRLTTPRTESMP